jgi:hypothetical protein
MAQGTAQRPANHHTREHIDDHRQVQPAGSGGQWSKKQDVVELFSCFSSPNRTCTFQRIRLSIQAWPMAIATSR